MVVKMLIPVIFCGLCLFCASINAEPPDSALAKIGTNKILIESSTEKFHINPSYLAAIIFTERTLNYDWKDDALDVLLAKAGRNSSIGFTQVKLKTAYWIERQLDDSLSVFFPGGKYTGIVPVSKSPVELLTKLQNDSLNILYAAAYLRIIQSRWAKAGFTIAGKPEIIGTLYSIGFFKPDGTERIPHASPVANAFGRKVSASLAVII